MAKRITADNIILKAAQLDEGAPCLRRVKRRWPAIILAARRTDKVRGRIILLIISIITIKGIKAGGVPKGTKWANILWGIFTQAIIMWPSHKGKAIAKVKDKWLEAVKI